MGKAMVQGHMPVGITAKTMADRDIAVAVMVVVSRNKDVQEGASVSCGCPFLHNDKRTARIMPPAALIHNQGKHLRRW